MIKKILNIFEQKLVDTDKLVEEIEKIYNVIPTDFGGGCSLQKGLLMSSLISNFKLKKTVDLGVYRGRSLFPQAFAHKLYTDGIVYGVDPYSNEAAVQNDRPDLKDALENFVNTTDFTQLYTEVKTMINSNNLQANCELVREKSSDATKFFKDNNHKLELVHIDGNHDTKFVMEDVANYVPLLEKKSFIVLDDISWDSVQPAYKLLKTKMVFINQLVNDGNDFALFAQGVSEREKSLLQKIFNDIKSK